MDRIKSKRKPAELVTETFEVELERNGGEVVYQFTIGNVLDAASMALAAKASRDPLNAMEGMLRAIRKAMLDSDGTPVKWEPRPYVAPGVEPVAEEHEEHLSVALDEDDAPALMVGPDGEPYPYVEAERFEAFEAGSSRRRWVYLMESEEDIVVDMDVLKGVFEKCVRLGANRPTRRSS